MSVQEQLTRLQSAKASLAAAISGKGVTVPETAKLDAYGGLVDQISTSGGGSGVRTCRLVIGTSAAGWTQSGCDVLCTGQGDDDAINNAIQQVGSMGGGEIVLLHGTYIASAPIMVSSPNITIRGNGPSTVIQQGYSATSSEPVGYFDVSGDYCEIYGIAFDRGGNITSTITKHVTLRGSSCSMHHCYGLGFSGQALVAEGPNAVIAYNCFQGATGISASGGNALVVCNSCQDCGEYGITTSDSAIVYGNSCSQSNAGLSLNGSNVLACGNQCVDCSTGIEIGDLNNSIISHNVCNKATTTGIKAESGISIMMANNQCIDFGDFGIMIAGGMRMTVQNNTCFRDAGYTDSQMTIGLLGGMQHVITGNYIKGKDVTNNAQVSSNTVVNNYTFLSQSGGST